jgi:glycosyltransferase involved in cell wall biosynthesis
MPATTVTEDLRKMRIGFDVSQTGSSKAGCGYFADSLLRQLATHDDNNEYVLYPAVGDVFWDPKCGRETFFSAQKNFRKLDAPTNFEASQCFWRNPGPDFEEQLGRPDIVHVNNFYCPTGLLHARLVYTLYDLSFLAHPEWTTEANRSGCARNLFRASLKADWMIAISEYTRRHFLRTYPHYPAERVAAVHLGSRFEGSYPTTRPARFTRLESGRFWLSVGTLEPRKNHLRLLEAYAMLKSQQPACLPLVLAGGKGWLMDQFERSLDEMRLRGDVVLTGYVEDSELQWLYENCFALVYPSLFEGFGLPVLEAMSLGAPVISSNTTSIPEVVGDAGILVNPEQARDIFEAMRKLSDEPSFREFLHENGRRRAAQFSWSSSACRVMALYGEIGAQRADTEAAAVPLGAR